MKRVMIIGSPGTGKSTFGRKLAAKTGLPLVHLDFYYHRKGKDYNGNDKPEWLELAAGLMAEPEWIIDGNNGSTIEERIRRADTVFYFDMPTHTALRGILKRRLWAHRTVRTDMPADWKENVSPKLLKHVWNFKKKYRVGVLELFDRYKDTEVITFHNQKQADDYLRVLD